MACNDKLNCCAEPSRCQSSNIPCCGARRAACVFLHHETTSCRRQGTRPPLIPVLTEPEFAPNSPSVLRCFQCRRRPTCGSRLELHRADGPRLEPRFNPTSCLDGGSLAARDGANAGRAFRTLNPCSRGSVAQRFPARFGGSEIPIESRRCGSVINCSTPILCRAIRRRLDPQGVFRRNIERSGGFISVRLREAVQVSAMRRLGLVARAGLDLSARACANPPFHSSPGALPKRV
jgi:hypothetical protein